jgi:hypothetical protein
MLKRAHRGLSENSEVEVKNWPLYAMMDQNKDTVVSCAEYVMTFMSYATSVISTPQCDNCDLIAVWSECASPN